MLNLENEIIHFILIDAQGSDMDVVESLGKYVKNALFIQIESVSKFPFYENQPLYSAEETRLKELGFKLIRIKPQTGDISEIRNGATDNTYVNENLLKHSNRELIN